MTKEEWDALKNEDRVYNPITGQWGTIRGWSQHSIDGRFAIRVIWDHLSPHDPRQIPWDTQLAKKLEVGIDAMKLYEELSRA